MKKVIDESDVLEYISRQVCVKYAEMEQYFGISNSTLYRICTRLKKRGWVELDKTMAFYTPCTIIPPSSAIDLPLKNALAQRAAELVESGDIICLAGSSIAVSLIFPFLVRSKKNVTIVSNSILVLRSYFNLSHEADESDIKLIALGGTIKKKELSFGGEYVNMVTSNLSIHKTFVGTEAADFSRGLFVDHIDNTAIEQKLMAVSKETYLVTDKSKFTEKKLFKWADWSEITGLVSDYSAIDEEIPPNLNYYNQQFHPL
ncbi:MAG: hypothetical protein ACRCY4_00500 [Brevinema sp.]